MGFFAPPSLSWQLSLLSVISSQLTKTFSGAIPLDWLHRLGICKKIYAPRGLGILDNKCFWEKLKTESKK